MDLVMDVGGAFNIEELRVGQRKTDTSYCRLEVSAASPAKLDEIVKRCRDLGAKVAEEQPVKLAEVKHAGVFPEGFYSSSNLPTYVLLGADWVPVERQEM